MSAKRIPRNADRLPAEIDKLAHQLQVNHNALMARVGPVLDLRIVARLDRVIELLLPPKPPQYEPIVGPRTGTIVARRRMDDPDDAAADVSFDAAANDARINQLIDELKRELRR